MDIFDGNATQLNSQQYIQTSGLERHTIVIDGYQLSYLQSGQGDPVLFLHGLGASAISWRLTLVELGQHFMVIAPDLPGCGESDKPEIDYTISFFADIMLKFVDALGIQKISVIGHSYGGGVTMYMYTLHPELFHKIALVSSAGFGRGVHLLLRASTLPVADGVLEMLCAERSPLPRISRNFEQRRLKRLHLALEDDQRTMLEKLQSPEQRQAFLAMIRNGSNLQGQKISAREVLPSITNPVLLVWGERDQTIPVVHAFAAASILTNAHVEIIPRCYHRPQIEAPEKFNAILLSFLQAEVWPPQERPELRKVRRPTIIRRNIRRIAPAALLLVGTTTTLLLGRRTRTRKWGEV